MHLGVRDVNSLNADSSLADLGLDSLMGVEIRQILERDYDIVMAMREIRQLTINKMREMVDSKPGGASGRTAPTLLENIWKKNLPRLNSFAFGFVSTQILSMWRRRRMEAMLCWIRI